MALRQHGSSQLAERVKRVQGKRLKTTALDVHRTPKITLDPAVTLRLVGVVLLRFRAGTLSATPGLDILAPTRQVSDRPALAMLLVQGTTLVHRWCYPPATQAENFKLFVRPEALPGRQNVTLQLSQTGCSNSTDVPLLQRCWASRGLYNDLAMAGADMEANTPHSNNYLVWLHEAAYICQDVMTDECVKTLGPLGCFYYVNSLRPPSPAPASPEEGGPGRGGGGLPAPAGLLVPGTDPARQSAVHGDDGGKQALLLPLLVGVLGGVAAVALALGATALLRRALAARRQAAFRAPGTDGDKKRQREPPGQVWVAPIGRLLSEGQVMPDGGAPASSSAEDASAGGVSGPLPPHVVVTLLTPQRPDLALGVACGGEVVLLPHVRGKGSFGRVQEGMFAGQRVAVKLLPRDLLDSEYTVFGGFAGAAAGGGGSGMEDAAAAAAPAAVAAGSAGSGRACSVTGGDGVTQQGTGPVGDNSPAAPAAAPGEPAAAVQAAPPPASALVVARELASFAQEVEVLGRCDHPNVVRLLAACLGPPQPCLVMELMESSLDRLLHARPAELLPLQTVLRIALDIARGLEYLHPTIVHRDLKPANVLVNVSGPTPVAKLSDFGLSRLRTTVLATRHPEAGTPAYMAPECFDTENLTITHQADIYSFAVIMWEMLTGLLPWWGCTPVAIAYTVTMLGERLPLGSIPPARCPPALRALMTQCFDAEPRRRPAAAELVKELRLVLKELPSANSPAVVGSIEPSPTVAPGQPVAGGSASGGQ
ncbi:hypothetical protein GPECTOR_8g304 [Gonium pectorale]|uniref:Protein kinase domain-containing protein n=1 Tax=Gonium pectorale TaxID=33097 RepID=A0A150GTB6_GONPE|nr:hypothetical protein GPECTOR_8g304 [Gonium pectorale]|eukprot:KXZ52928.1 hypothetical protein GPECTOR_8g304 [Gonium pectorale]